MRMFYVINTRSLWYLAYQVLHKDVKVPKVKKEISKFCQKIFTQLRNPSKQYCFEPFGQQFNNK